MTKSSLKFIFFVFIVWRVVLQIIIILAAKYLPLQQNFLGGGSVNYLSNIHFWAWGNFDGQHYVNIAQNGYGFGEYTFFPLYPLILKSLGVFFGSGLFQLNLIGQLISNICVLVGLIGFYKLAKIDYSETVARLSIITLLVFPTSFYYAAVYTESLFFTMLVWSYYFFLSKKYLPASILGALLSALRPVGVLIFPAFLIDWWVWGRKDKNSAIKFPYITSLIPLGLFAYMGYLKYKLGNALAFFSSQVYVGEHRSKTLILFPQILYRYIFKILPSINYSYFPVVFFTYLEFGISLLFLGLIIVMFFVSRPGYALFSFLAYITPTLLGSFSSQPRYVLILFPVFLLITNLLYKKRFALFAFWLVSFILLVISFSLFSRGYWLS